MSNKLSLNLLDQLSERNTTKTPDFLELKSDHHIPVFVYGSLKSGHRNHEMLSGCQFLGRGRTVATDLDLRAPSHNAFPIAFRKSIMKTPKEVLGRVSGEIWVVDPKKMLEMDTFENNRTMYNREKVWVVCRDQEIKGSTNKQARPTIQAWMYIGVPDYWEGQVTDRCPYLIEGVSKEFFWHQKYH